MEPALALAVIMAGACGAPFVVAGVGAVLGGIAHLRVRAPGRAASALALLLALRGVPTGAAPPPPGERLITTGERPGVPDPPALQPGWHPAPTYRVVAGDSLWAIACRSLAAGGAVPTDAAINRYWRVIYAANRSVVGSDPDLIFPGQLLVMPPET